MNETSQLITMHQQLLRDLKSTVESLLNSQVANVWSIYGGLNRLHVDVEKIFKQGCRICNISNESSYWQFIQGLEWLQPDTSNSTFSIDCEYKPHLPQLIKNDRASIWLYRSLENHSLSQKLSWLLSDKTHILACYQSEAFLCQNAYAEATLICLRAVERNQPSLISDINPSLFLLTNRDYHKSHRRCSSYPDARLKEHPMKTKVGHSFDSNLVTIVQSNEEKKVIKGKLRTWNSMPNLGPNKKPIRNRCNTLAQSYTMPSTPIATNDKVSPSLLSVDYDALQRSIQKEHSVKSSIKLTAKKRPLKHVLINYDIVEHTPSLINAPNHVETHKEIKSPIGSFAQDYNFMGSIAGEKDFKKKPKKTFIEDGGMSVVPMSTGYFPRPSKGQTLTSFLMSSQFSRANAILDRENAHFSISEAMISAMEQIKCKKDVIEESDEEINQLKQRIRLCRRQKLVEKQQQKLLGTSLLSDGKTDTTEPSPSTSLSTECFSTTSSSSEEDVEDLEIDEASNLSDNRGMSMSMASLYYEADLLKRPRGAPDGASDILSAEDVALSLISKFSEKQLPRASDLEWLVSEEEAPQSLLPLPKSWPISPDDAEIPVTLLRGTTEWAPPRPQIIFTLHPMISRSVLMAQQNYRCAGCGMRVAQQYASKFRYCHYLGKFFCTGCHTNQLALIPARVIQKWNFTRYAVSSFSYRLLEQMNFDPLFRVFELNKNISKRSRNLQICRKYRQGLTYLKDFILTCRFAETIQDYFKTEHSYIFNDPEVYSIDDLCNVKTGEMKSRLKCIIEMCCRHTTECELCQARGFICEICNNGDVLFPWQMRIVARCQECGCCYHFKCWKAVGEICARCIRVCKRKETSHSTTEDEQHEFGVKSN